MRRVTNAQDAKTGLALEAMDSLLAEDPQTALAALEALVQTANEQRGNQLPESEADALIAQTSALIALLQ